MRKLREYETTSISPEKGLLVLILDHGRDENQFTEKYKEILIYNSFYSPDEFFNYCQDL
jgi:hypothetical protein